MPTEADPSKQNLNILFIILMPLVFLLGLGSGYLLWGRIDAPAATSTPAVQRINVSVDNNPSIGPENAPVTIIEFSDYECPYCKLWNDQVFDRLMANYPEKVRFVYRDFPLNGHAEALPAAEAADCAGEQKAYWKYHKALFGQQYGLDRTAYQRYAAELGLNVNTFIECLDSNRYQSEVTADLQYASMLGVQSTPTFFINGMPLVGAQSYDTFKQIIDQELARLKK